MILYSKNVSYCSSHFLPMDKKENTPVLAWPHFYFFLLCGQQPHRLIAGLTHIHRELRTGVWSRWDDDTHNISTSTAYPPTSSRRLASGIDRMTTHTSIRTVVCHSVEQCAILYSSVPSCTVFYSSSSGVWYCCCYKERGKELRSVTQRRIHSLGREPSHLSIQSTHRPPSAAAVHARLFVFFPREGGDEDMAVYVALCPLANKQCCCGLYIYGSVVWC